MVEIINFKLKIIDNIPYYIFDCSDNDYILPKNLLKYIEI